MNYLNKQIFLTVFVIVFSVACITNKAETDDQSLKKPLKNEMTEKWKLQQTVSLDKANPLKVVKSFISENDQSIKYPSSLMATENGQVYILDNNGNSILKVSSDAQVPVQFSNKAKNEDESLKYPNTIKFYQQKIYISDNDGIKVFNDKGEFEKTIRTYFSINDFTIDTKGDFFINPNFLDSNQENPLIIKLNDNGKRIGEIGKIDNFAEYNGLEGKVYLDISNKYIFAAYKHLPLLKIFDIEDGRLIREVKVKATVFEKLGKLKENKEFVNPQKGINILPRYISGLKISQDKIFLLLHLPYPEILELDFQGNEINRLRIDDSRKQNYFGFDVTLVNGVNHFLVGAIESTHRPTLTEFADKNTD